jgi:nucleolar protein 15
MGGKGGMKKQRSPKGGAKVITVVPGGSGTSAAGQPKGKKASSASASASPASAKKSRSPSLSAFEPLKGGGDEASDYSEGEEEEEAASSTSAPMALDATTTASLKRTLKQQAAKRPSTQPTPKGAGVLYVGHIPHGFYEEQMRGFFSQFGTVSRLRLARNKKTGRSKHYAFVEFKQREVAEVVAKAMNGYLLFSKILVAKVVPPSDVHPETFKGAERPFKVIDRTAIARKEHNKPRTAERAARREAALLKGERAKRAKLAKAGIDYSFDGYVADAARSRKRVRGVILTAGEDAEADAEPATKPTKAAATKAAATKAAATKAAATKAADEKKVKAAAELEQPPSKKAKKAPEAAASEAAPAPAKKKRKAEEEAPAPAAAPAKKAPAKKTPKQRA